MTNKNSQPLPEIATRRVVVPTGYEYFSVSKMASPLGYFMDKGMVETTQVGDNEVVSIDRADGTGNRVEIVKTSSPTQLVVSSRVMTAETDSLIKILYGRDTKQYAAEFGPHAQETHVPDAMMRVFDAHFQLQDTILQSTDVAEVVSISALRARRR
jgi:hypothetical protein